MRTTVTLDENLVGELLSLTHAKTKTGAVTLAVKEHIRRAKLRKLAALPGTVDIDEKAVNEGDKADMRRAHRLEEIGKWQGYNTESVLIDTTRPQITLFEPVKIVQYM